MYNFIMIGVLPSYCNYQVLQSQPSTSRVWCHQAGEPAARRTRRLSAAGAVARPGTGIFGGHAFLITGSAACSADKRRATKLILSHGGIVLDQLPSPHVRTPFPGSSLHISSSAACVPQLDELHRRPFVCC